MLARVPPVRGLAFFLINGQSTAKLASFSFPRFRSIIVMMVAIWSLLNAGSCAWFNWLAVNMHRQPKQLTLISIRESLFYSSSFPSVLLAILIWTMPVRHQRIPKRN
jgi:hypothetical protein